MKLGRAYKRSYKIAIAILVVLVIARLLLPYFVKKYINKTLNELPGYYGHVEDVDLSLYRGAYKIDKLFLNEDGQDPKNPFLQIELIDLSIEWKSLFKGKLVSEITMRNPKLYVISRSGRPAQEPTREHWSDVVKKLMPITINRLEVHNGRLTYLDYTTSPDLNFFVHDMELTAHNLANVDRTGNALPSTVHMTGSSIGGGALKSNMRVNMLKKLPDFDMKLQLTNVNLTSLNSFIKAYGKFDVERGKLDLYSELRMMNGQFKGYLKPFFEDLKVLDWQKDKEEGGVLSAVKEAVVGLLAEGVEYQPKDQVATIIPIEGTVKETDVNISRTIINTLKHGFISTFSKGLEQKLSAGTKQKKDTNGKKNDKKKEEKKKDDKKKDDKK